MFGCAALVPITVRILLVMAMPQEPQSVGLDLNRQYSRKLGNGVIFRRIHRNGARCAELQAGPVRSFFYGQHCPEFHTYRKSRNRRITEFTDGTTVDWQHDRTVCTTRQSDRNIYYERIDSVNVTLVETQLAGKFFPRSVHFRNGVSITESGDGSLQLAVNGNPRISITCGGDVRHDLSAAEVAQQSDQLSRNLPRRPKFIRLADGTGTATFSIGAILSNSPDGSVSLQLRGAKFAIPTSPVVGDRFAREQWSRFINQDP